jgi:hypothetical protein
MRLTRQGKNSGSPLLGVGMSKFRSLNLNCTRMALNPSSLMRYTMLAKSFVSRRLPLQQMLQAL